MSTLIYSATMSLDGFIAGPGGDMSWLTPHLEGPNPDADALVPRVGAVLVGGTTFRGDDPNRGDAEKEGAFSGGWEGPHVVLTRRPPVRPAAGLTFVSDVGEAITTAREAAGDLDVHVLGAVTARACLDAGALDEIVVFVAPVLLGDGVRLFERPGGTDVRLERLAAGGPPNASYLRYRVLR
ncbi:dihydrofolate reductase family protein [Patulibacter minatonensis]|uniref:dihydrofolate reductase family protein n=1 Tax=Patulibacter minatonensis TaxID=298163 RepID=UPI00047BF910|nr:dihydrofolate reductase family protein [Patulibacter minatonensis]